MVGPWVASGIAEDPDRKGQATPPTRGIKYGVPRTRGFCAALQSAAYVPAAGAVCTALICGAGSDGAV